MDRQIVVNIWFKDTKKLTNWVEILQNNFTNSFYKLLRNRRRKKIIIIRHWIKVDSFKWKINIDRILSFYLLNYISFLMIWEKSIEINN